MPIGEVVGERAFTVEGQPDVIVVVRLGKPVARKPADFRCPYEIEHQGDRTLRYAIGIDSIEALRSALKMIAADIGALNRGLGGGLRWLETSQDLGLD